MFFDVGFQELVVIAVLILLFIPPDDLPKLMRVLGRYYAKIRRASDDLRRAFNAEVAKVEAEERREELARRREEMAKRRAEVAPGEVPADPDVMLPDPRLPPDAAPRRVRREEGGPS
jgi:Tat protein translocase TatB subunit